MYKNNLLTTFYFASFFFRFIFLFYFLSLEAKHRLKEMKAN